MSGIAIRGLILKQSVELALINVREQREKAINGHVSLIEALVNDNNFTKDNAVRSIKRLREQLKDIGKRQRALTALRDMADYDDMSDFVLDKNDFVLLQPNLPQK